MQVPQRHALDQESESGLFVRAIEPPVTVPLVDDVVMLGVQPARELGMASERIDRAVIVPAPIDISRAALVPPDIAEFRVEHRLARLAPGLLEVPLRSRIRAVAGALHAGFPAPPRQVFMP